MGWGGVLGCLQVFSEVACPREQTLFFPNACDQLASFSNVVQHNANILGCVHFTGMRKSKCVFLGACFAC